MKNVKGDHHGGDISVAQKALDGADVGFRFKEMGSKGMPESVRWNTPFTNRHSVAQDWETTPWANLHRRVDFK